jgi:hypothetical protein
MEACSLQAWSCRKQLEGSLSLKIGPQPCNFPLQLLKKTLDQAQFSQTAGDLWAPLQVAGPGHRACRVRRSAVEMQISPCRGAASCAGRPTLASGQANAQPLPRGLPQTQVLLTARR